MSNTPNSTPDGSSDKDSSDTSWLKQRLQRHIGEMLRLAPPIIISRTGILLLLTTDYAMLGLLLGEEADTEIGYYALATSLFIFFMVTGFGLVQGTAVIAAHRFGAERFLECGATWRRGMIWAVLVGILFSVLTAFSGSFFLATGQAPDLAQGAGEAAFWMALGLGPQLIFATCSNWLEALKRPMPGLTAILAALVANAGLNLLLIPGWGADGAAAATSLCRLAIGVALFLYVWRLKDAAQLGVRTPADPGKGSTLKRWWRGSAEQRRYGYAAGAAYGFESASFSILQIYAGLMGATASAAFGIGMNLTALLFMGALGLAVATSVRVGIAHGRNDLADRALAGWTGYVAATLLMGVFCLVLVFQTDWVIALYTSAPELVVMLLPVVFLIGFVMLGDGVQIVMSNSIRSAGEPWVATILNFISYGCLQIPLGYFLGIILGRGVVGLFEAILIGAIVSSLMLTTRWVWLCRGAFRGH